MARFRYDSQTDAALARTLSESRFDVYLTTVGGLDVQASIDLYVWNLRLGSSFYGALAIFEVTLRNALHHALTELYGAHWFNSPRFVAMARAVLDPRPRPVRSPEPKHAPEPTDLLRDIAKVEERLTRELQNEAGESPAEVSRLAPTADDVVAALDFGYWTDLFNRDLDAPLFVKQLHKAFPLFRNGAGVPKNPTRSDVARELNSIRKFRNRVMHFEPLFKGNVVSEFNRILKVCSWIDDDAANWIRYHSSLEELFRDRDRPRHRL